MPDLIADSVFGRIVNLASGGKVFAPIEQRDPSRLVPYAAPKSTSSSDSNLPVEPALDEKADHADDGDGAEKGTDTQLVDWLENDPEV